MNIKIITQICIGAISYGVWAFMAWSDPTLRHDFLNFNIALASGTVGLAVRDMLPAASRESYKSSPDIAHPEIQNPSATTT